MTIQELIEDYAHDYREIELSQKELSKIFSYFSGDVFYKIQKLITEEILIAQHEGEKTSRLTSLWNKIEKL
jgi:hypothetical protein